MRTMAVLSLEHTFNRRAGVKNYSTQAQMRVGISSKSEHWWARITDKPIISQRTVAAKNEGALVGPHWVNR